MISSNNLIYFGQTGVHITYNELIFGSGAMQNGKVIFTLGSKFSKDYDKSIFGSSWSNIFMISVYVKDTPGQSENRVGRYLKTTLSIVPKLALGERTPI